MLIALFIIVGLSLLILGHEAGHFLAAKLFGLKVDEFGFGFPPRLWAWRRKKTLRDGEGALRHAHGETEYSINWLPFGGFVKIAGEHGEFGAAGEDKGVSHARSFFFQPAWKRGVIIAAGVTMNFLFGWFLLSSTLLAGTPRAVIVEGVAPHSPAAAAGFAPGDRMLGFTSVGDLVSYINAHRGQETAFTISRGDSELHVLGVPRVSPPPDEGALGVALAETGRAPEGFFRAFRDGFQRSLETCWLVLGALYGVLRDIVLHGSVSPDVAGPVGIVAVAEEAGRIGFSYLVELLSLISLNLAVVNLIPFPALDGGRLLLILVEKVKGSPLPRRVEEIVNGVGFALLLVLMVFITAHDIMRWW